MGRYLDAMKVMTVDPACHRLGEIADELSARLDAVEKRRCPCDAAARPPAPEPGQPAAPQ